MKKSAGFTTVELVVIFTVVVLLAIFVGSKYSAVRQNTRDDERKNDITALQLGIQSYWAQTGNFPSLEQINQSAFRNSSLNKLLSGAARDPRWSVTNKYCSDRGEVRFEESTAPHTGCYGYNSSPANCDNKAILCSGYQLHAKLEAGGYYTKFGG